MNTLTRNISPVTGHAASKGVLFLERTLYYVSGVIFPSTERTKRKGRKGPVQFWLIPTLCKSIEQK